MFGQAAVQAQHDDLGGTGLTTQVDLRVQARFIAGALGLLQDDHAGGVFTGRVCDRRQDGLQRGGCCGADNHREHATGRDLATLLTGLVEPPGHLTGAGVWKRDDHA